MDGWKYLIISDAGEVTGTDSMQNACAAASSGDNNIVIDTQVIAELTSDLGLKPIPPNTDYQVE